MTHLVIDRKKYVLIPEREYLSLQKKAALNSKSERIVEVEEARTYSKKLINERALESHKLKGYTAKSIVSGLKDVQAILSGRKKGKSIKQIIKDSGF